MTIYQLQMTFSATEDGKANQPDIHVIEAETSGDAIARAKAIVYQTQSKPLHAATLRSPDGFVIWSLRSPAAG